MVAEAFDELNDVMPSSAARITTSIAPMQSTMVESAEAQSLYYAFLARLGALGFETPDLERFPCLGYAQAALDTGGVAPAVLNAANEVAVAAFLAGRARFTDIARACAETLARWHRRLARALAAVINLLDPDHIVLGGGLSNVPRLAEDVAAQLPAWVFSNRVDTVLVRNRHGDSSGVRGAAWLWPVA